MYIVYGIAAIILCCLIQFGLIFILQTSVLDLGMLFFFGVFFASLFVAEKMMTGLIKSNKKDTKIRCLVCLSSGIITFLALYYIEFISNNIHLKVFEHQILPTYFTFFDYITYKLNYVNQRYMTKQGHVGTYPTSGIPNYVIFILQILCSIFGAYIGYLRKKTDFCDECRKYYKTKKLFCATYGDLGQIIKNGQIKISDLKKFESFIDNHKLSTDNKRAKYIGLLLYCPHCGKAKLTISNESYNYKNKKEFREKTVDIDNTWTKTLVEKNTNKY